MEMIIGCSYAKYSNESFAEKLQINKENQFAYVIERLEDIREFDPVGVDVYSDLLYVLKNISVVKEDFYTGNLLYVSTEEIKALAENISQTYFDHASSVHELWLNMLRNTNDNIDEEFRYGANESNEDIQFLRNVVTFLSYVTITQDQKPFQQYMEYHD